MNKSIYRIIINFVIAVILLAIIYTLIFSELLGFDNKEELVTIIAGDCDSHLYGSISPMTGAFKSAEKCFSQVRRSNGDIVKAMSNCPSYTKGWEVSLLVTSGYFTHTDRLILDGRPYIDLTLQYRRVSVKDKNALFYENINHKFKSQT